MRDTLRHRPRRPTSAGSLTAAVAAGAVASLGFLLAASEARAQTPTLGASDFTVLLSAKNAAGKSHTFTTDELTNLLPAARCSCPITLTAAVQINSASLANVTSNDSFMATVMVGSSCDVANNSDCIQLGAALKLDADTTSAQETFSSTNLLMAAAGGGS